MPTQAILVFIEKPPYSLGNGHDRALVYGYRDESGVPSRDLGGFFVRGEALTTCLSGQMAGGSVGRLDT